MKATKSRVGIVFASLLLISGAVTADAPPQSIAGTWKLITWTDRNAQTQMPYYPFGTHPTGMFIFTPDGHFSVQVESDTNGALPPDLPRKDFDDLMGPYLGFFGTYTFDTAADTLALKVAGSSAPAYVMSDTSRTAHFDRNRLILSGQSVRRNGHIYTWERVLERDNR